MFKQIVLFSRWRKFSGSEEKCIVSVSLMTFCISFKKFCSWIRYQNQSVRSKHKKTFHFNSILSEQKNNFPCSCGALALFSIQSNCLGVLPSKCCKWRRCPLSARRWHRRGVYIRQCHLMHIKVTNHLQKIRHLFS